MFRRVAALAMLMILLLIGVEAAPTERDPLAPRSAGPERSVPLRPSHRVKQRLVSTNAARLDGTAKTTTTAGAGTRSGSEEAGPGRTAHVLKMISALEGLHRTLDGTIMPRAHGRGRKNKGKPPHVEGGPKPTTAPPADSTASRASAMLPSLTGRSFRKSLPPQNKKTNKRVCFWKYCSQN